MEKLENLPWLIDVAGNIYSKGRMTGLYDWARAPNGFSKKYKIKIYEIVETANLKPSTSIFSFHIDFKKRLLSELEKL